LDAAERVIRGLGVALVVEIVEQGDGGPGLFVLVELARVAADGGFDGEHVLAQALARGPLGHERSRRLSGWGDGQEIAAPEGERACRHQSATVIVPAPARSYSKESWRTTP